MGGSSLKAAHEIRKAEADVLGMIAIFTYGFPEAIKLYVLSPLRKVG